MRSGPATKNEWPQEESLCPNQTGARFGPTAVAMMFAAISPDMAMIRKDSTGIFGRSTAFDNGTGPVSSAATAAPRWPRRLAVTGLLSASTSALAASADRRPQVAECRGGLQGVDKVGAGLPASRSADRRRPCGLAMRMTSLHLVGRLTYLWAVVVNSRAADRLIDARPT